MTNGSGDDGKPLVRSKGTLNPWSRLGIRYLGSEVIFVAVYSNCSKGISNTFMRSTSRLWFVIVCLAVLPTTGCLFRTRPVEDKISTAPLKQATPQEVIDAINQQAEAIKSLKATVDIDSSAGG